MKFLHSSVARVAAVLLLLASTIWGIVHIETIRNQFGELRPFKIHFVNYRGHTDIDIYFERYLKSEKINYDIVYHDVNRNPANFPGIVTKIANDEDADLVLTWGTTTTLALQGTYDKPVKEAISKIPGIFVIVTDPIETRIVSSLHSSFSNLTGTIHIAPLYNQFRAMIYHLPSPTIGMLYAPTEKNSVLTESQLRSMALRHSIKLIAIPFEVVNGVPQLGDYKAALKKISDSGAKWLYLPPDSFLSVHAKQHIIPEAHRLGLITFASTEHLMQSGAAFGLLCPYAQLGILAGQKAVAILRHGILPKDLPINSPPFFQHQVNLKAVSDLGLKVSLDQLKDMYAITTE